MMGDRSLISTWEQDIILAHMSEGDRIRPLHKPGNSDFGPVLGKTTRKILLGKTSRKLAICLWLTVRGKESNYEKIKTQTYTYLGM